MSAKRRSSVVLLDVSPRADARRLPKDFLSLTIDTSLLLGGHWWGPKKGLRNGVAGERTPALDLKNKRFRAYAAALSPAMLRIGGTEADRLSYRMGKKAVAAYGLASPEQEAEGGTDVSHEFVLRKGLWRRLHEFLAEVGFSLLFTLSAGPADRDTAGRWKEDNARKLIAYSQRKGYPVAAWELGNEVNAYPFIHGFSNRVSGRRYADDFRRFGFLARRITPDAKLLGPASAIWPRIGEPNPLIRALCSSAGAAFLDAVSWHYYPQQSSYGRVATRRAAEGNMLSARCLDDALRYNDRVHASIIRAAPYRPSGAPIENWVTETAHALYGGESGLSDTFVSTLWWLDELGLFAREGVAKVFRQALVGARYGLLDQDSMDPRPDYYASFLWKRLMGSRVHSVRPPAGADRKMRVYVHAREDAPEWTVLALNLSRRKAARIVVQPPGLPQGTTPYAPRATRYLLQGDGAFASRTMLLNGVRVGDDLVFGWGEKSIRSKYHIATRETEGIPTPSFSFAEELPPLSALFLSVTMEGIRKKRRR